MEYPGASGKNPAAADPKAASTRGVTSWRVEEAEPVSRPSGIMTTVAWILRQMGVVSALDTLLPWDAKQCKLSPGTRLLALILCTLFDRTALWRVHRVFARQDLDVLFGQNVRAADFNDDALGRALDKLAAARPAHVFHSVAAKVWAHERVPFDTLHGDTAAAALFGAYTAPTPETLQIVHGYSKDHRPDLKQIGVGLVCNPQGIPLLGDVHDGNLNDNKWNSEVIACLREVLPEETLRSILYTADCKVVTPDNLRAMDEAGLHWLSRLPETYEVAEQLKVEAWAGDEWDAPAPMSSRARAAHYRLHTFADVTISKNPKHALAGLRYRCVVVHSTALETHARTRQQRLIATERQSIEDALAAKPTFATAAAADQASTDLVNKLKLRYHNLRLLTQPVEVLGKHSRRGRPRKDAPPPPPATRFGWKAETEPPNSSLLTREIQLRSCFVLITNDASRTAWELLAVYKRQQTAVEIPFHRTKALPVAPMFLDRPERVRAMGYILLLSYVAFAVIQRRVRHELTAQGEQLPTFENRRTATPTAEVVLEHLSDIHTEIAEENGAVVRVVKITPVARRVLTLLGVPLDAFAASHANSP